MPKYTTADLRNVCLIGHGDAGKTSLADHLLSKAGAVSRSGSVKEKTSVFDFEPDEKDRGHSISSAIGHLSWKGKEVNLIDCPGYPDFIGDTVIGLNGADLCLVCVNAHSGVMVNTRKVWHLAERAGRARAIVVTKTDQAPGELGKVLAQIQASFGPRCIPWKPGAETGDTAGAWTEAVVEADDELMMRYLDGQTIAGDELKRAERAAVARGLVFPVIFTSAEKGTGLEEVLDFIAELGPSPFDAKRRVGPRADAANPGVEINPAPEGPFLAYVWRLQVDKHVGKIAHVRVVQGTLKAGDHFINLRADKKEKVGTLARMQGKDTTTIDQAIPGDLVVLTKLDSLHVGDTLTSVPADAQVRMVPSPNPMYSLAVVPKSRGDEAKISEALARMADECPTFKPHREFATHEQVVTGMSQLHVDLMLKRMKERFQVEVETHRPKIPYKECVVGVAEGHWRHKKQSGGRGQFAEVYLAVGPGESGSGLTYSWDIFGGSIPRNFEPAIEKGIREKMVHGIIAGYAISDIKVSIRDGKYHDVDSSEAAFKIAGGRAFADAVMKARPTILEPIVKLEITIPGQFMGDISGDLNTRRGRIVGMDQAGDFQILKAEMPLSEASEYARVLTSITSGEGTFTMEPSHYEQVPGQIQQQLMAAFKPHHEED